MFGSRCTATDQRFLWCFRRGQNLRPRFCASRIVSPNTAHASRNRPLFVRYGPISKRVCIVKSVGRERKEPIRNACIAAATRLDQHRSLGMGFKEVTKNIASLRFRIYCSSNPSFTAAIVDPTLQPLRHGGEEQSEHIRVRNTMMLNVLQKTFDL